MFGTAAPGALPAMIDHGQSQPTPGSALTHSARHSIAGAMRRSFGLVLLAALVAGGAVAIAGADMMAGVAVASVLGLVALGGWLAIDRLAAAFAQLATRPVELLLAQPGMAKEMLPESVNWRAGRALSRAQVESDLAVLESEMERLGRQSHALVAELARAREEANQQNLAKSQFVAKMSHELRTPLNAILGYAMLLHEDAAEKGDELTAADLLRIESAGRSLLTIINDVLDLTKIEAGKAVLDRGLIDVQSLVSEVAASFPEESRNGNRFDVVLSDNVRIMIGDRGKVRQCLLNLIGNAFKFTSGGDVTLIVESVSRDPTPLLRFIVRDTGIGIDEASLPGLFDSFSQVDGDAARRFGGTGLGLTITRRLALMMGGECSVVSRKGEGSEFTLSVPMRPSAEAPGAEPQLAVPAQQPLPDRRWERSALVIDHDEAAIDLLRRWLGRIGYDVYTAGDGETGLAMARQFKPDLVVLDVLLPRRSGYDVLRELREDPEIGLTPVILITIDDDRARGLDAGASEYLRKPVTADQLRTVTETYRAKTNGDILVIEDNDSDAELIKRSVEQVGFSTRRASDGLEGVAMAASSRPTAIVLDLVMPRLDGFGVIERLAADEQLTDIPLIVLSGADLSIGQHRKLAAAGHRFFTKGVTTPREIAQALREVAAC